MILTLLGFLLGMGLIIYSFIAKHYNKTAKSNELLPGQKQTLWIGVFIAVSMFLYGQAIADISGKEVGVVKYPWGVSKEPLRTGWNFVIPFISKVVKFDKTVFVYTFSNIVGEGQKAQNDAIWAPTKDGIKMGFNVSISWRIDAEQAPWIYQNIASEEDENGRFAWIEENIIRPKSSSAIQQTVSQFTPIEAYSSGRLEIQRQSKLALQESVKGYKIIIDDVNIRDVFYNKEYEASINAKKLAEQEVQRLQMVTQQKEEELKQSKINKDITIQEAMGKAEALRIQGTAITSNPQIIQLEWIKAWAAGGSKVPQFIGGSGGSQFIMDISKLHKGE
jgi:regulator of protease activity HflC (stomatin/prohibitin superfamily)